MIFDCKCVYRIYICIYVTILFCVFGIGGSYGPLRNVAHGPFTLKGALSDE